MTEEKTKVKPRGFEEVKPLSGEEKKEVAPAAPKKEAPKKAPAKKKAVAKKATKPVKRYSFDQWASRREVKARHRGGLRAFVTNPRKHRTLEEWDKCFIGY